MYSIPDPRHLAGVGGDQIANQAPSNPSNAAGVYPAFISLASTPQRPLSSPHVTPCETHGHATGRDLDMRQATACKECRIAKRKCTREGSDRVCTPCRQRNLTCGYTDTQRRELRHSHRTDSRRGISPVHNEEAADSVDRLSQAEFVSLAEIYLTKIHGQAHCIFHPPTLRWQLRNNSVPKALLYAMCAIGSKFSPDPQHQEIGHHLALEAKRLLQADMENICLENIQACILVSMLGAGNCHISSEALFIRKEQAPLEPPTTCLTSTHRDICRRHGDEHGSHHETRVSRQ